MSTPPTHLVILGTGLTSLLITRSLLLSTTLPNIRLTLIDKAKNPGGRLTSRTYDDGTVLETGARVFQSSMSSMRDGETTDGGNGFEKEVERWEGKGFVRSVERVQFGSQGSSKAHGKGKWWEGVGGFGKGLVGGLLDEIKEVSKGRVEFRYEVTAANPTPVDSTSSNLELTLDPPQELKPINYLVHTAPSPQTLALLPSSLTSAGSRTTYLKTFALLLPTIKNDNLPVYHRDPHPLINSIATGVKSSTSSTSQGIVIQSTPEKLGIGYTKDEFSDDLIKSKLFDILKEENLLDERTLKEAQEKKGRESQIKRWKFAQVSDAVDLAGQADYHEEGKRTIVLEGERVILAGDGTVGGAGGVEGAWLAAMEATQILEKWLTEAEGKSKM